MSPTTNDNAQQCIEAIQKLREWFIEYPTKEEDEQMNSIILKSSPATVVEAVQKMHTLDKAELVAAKRERDIAIKQIEQEQANAHRDKSEARAIDLETELMDWEQAYEEQRRVSQRRLAAFEREVQAKVAVEAENLRLREALERIGSVVTKTIFLTPTSYSENTQVVLLADFFALQSLARVALIGTKKSEGEI